MSGSHELAIERTIDAPVTAVWRAITDHLTEWWCPRPWTSEIVALEWRSGGPFAITMRSPEGDAMPGDGVLLEVVPERRIVFTNMLNAAWEPQNPQPLGIVGVFELTDLGDKTGYRAASRHWSAEDHDKHDTMGFAQGWGVCADQLEEVAKRLAS